MLRDDAHDAGVREAGHLLHHAVEALDAVFVLGPLGVEHLHGDLAVEHLIVALPDRARGAAADLAQEAITTVVAEVLAGLQGGALPALSSNRVDALVELARALARELLLGALGEQPRQRVVDLDAHHEAAAVHARDHVEGREELAPAVLVVGALDPLQELVGAHRAR